MYEDISDLTRKLQDVSAKEATRQLCSFFVECRFKDENFSDNYIDASRDGGIDYFYSSGDQFYIIQSKYNSKNSAIPFDNIQTEIDKIIETIGHPTNERLRNLSGNDFINKVRANLNNSQAIIDIYYLTTGKIEPATCKQTDTYLRKRVADKGWKIRVSFNPADNVFLETMIINNRYGFIPYTGKKEVSFDKKPLEVTISNIDSLAGVVPISQLLGWFENRKDIDRFLQKNVRGYLETRRENKDIMKSYSEEPSYFWFKHNGIVIFVDHYDFDVKNGNKVYLSNPQIVNGGQTINSVYSAYLESGTSNEARVLLRIIKLPYDRVDSYQRGLGFIEALNTQVHITAADLHSNDEIQVQIQRIIEKINRGYVYVRKRKSDTRISDTNVVKEQLANLINCCKREKPNEAIRMELGKLFRDNYDKIFDRNRILLDFEKNTEVYEYLVIWRIHRLIIKARKQLAQKYQNLFYATQYYVALDVYRRLSKLRQRMGKPWSIWFDFAESYNFQDALTKYTKLLFRRTYSIIPKSEKNSPDNFYKQAKAVAIAEKELGLANEFNGLFPKAYSEYEQSYQTA
jgi:hypothetical protein